jgi:putative membrane protein
MADRGFSITRILMGARKYALLIVVVFHAVGLLLLGGPWRAELVVLTPINLLLLGGLYLNSSASVDRPVLFAIPALFGFIIEVIGVNTGFPFGIYEYSGILGPRILETPILIGLLWWVLVRASYDVMGRFTGSTTLRSLGVGVIMTALDLLIEPVAIALNFWQWQDPVVPVENYLAWFVCSTLFARITASGHATNVLSLSVLVVQFAFFAALGIIL